MFYILIVLVCIAFGLLILLCFVPSSVDIAISELKAEIKANRKEIQKLKNNKEV